MIRGQVNTPLRVKSAGPDDGLAEGEFEGYASVFGNVDSYGDIVQPGAFERTLGEWGEKGNTVPVLWGHDMQDPFANIGGLSEISEDDHGLKIRGQLDLDNPTAMQVYRLLKGRRTNRMSFAYAVRDSSENDAGGNDLKDLDLFEVSVVQVPANDLAEVTQVKTLADRLVKAGRKLSAANETALREARAAIDTVLESLDDDDEPVDDEPEDDEENAKHVQANASQVPATPASAKAPVEAPGSPEVPVERLAAQARLYALV